MKLDKYDIALANACAKDDGRPVLTNVCYRNGKLAASDGFALVVREVEKETSEDYPDTLLPAKILKTIKPTQNKVAELTIDSKCQVTYKKVTGENIESEPTNAFKPSTSGTFPNYAQLFPKGQDKTAKSVLSVGLLKRVLSCLPNDGVLRIGLINTPDEKASSQPIEFECSNIDRPIYGMIMPMYVDWSDFKWHREPEEKKEIKES